MQMQSQFNLPSKAPFTLKKHQMNVYALTVDGTFLFIPRTKVLVSKIVYKVYIVIVVIIK